MVHDFFQGSGLFSASGYGTYIVLCFIGLGLAEAWSLFRKR